MYPLVVHVETVRMSQLPLGRLIIRQVSTHPSGVRHGCYDCSITSQGSKLTRRRGGPDNLLETVIPRVLRSELWPPRISKQTRRCLILATSEAEKEMLMITRGLLFLLLGTPSLHPE
jgi:hypothetical protein